MTHDDPQTRDRAEAPTVVLHDAYDRAAFDRAVANHTGLAERIEAGRRIYAGFWSLAFDVFCVLFKYAVALEPERDAARGRTAIARRVIGWVLSAPDLERLRAETTLDEPRATFGTTRILDLVRGMLTRHGEASSASLGEELELAEVERELEELHDLLETARELEQSREVPDPEAFEAARDGLEEEVDELTRDRKRLLQQQQRRLDKMPATTESALRDLVATLPDRLDRSEAELAEFGRNIGVASDADTAALLELGDELVANKKLRALSRLVGAFRDYARGLRQHRLERRPAEVHAITRGSDLGHVLPVERSLLLHPVLKLDFMRRLVEGQLLQYAIEAPDNAGRGPLVVCLDGSGSMQGDKEVWAKAVALTLMEIARKERRQMRTIVFSGSRAELRTFDLLGPRSRRAAAPPPVDVTRVLEFARYFPRGGTDFEAPLSVALELLQEVELTGGDIVLVTDGESQVQSVWLDRFLAEKARLKFAVYAVLVDIGGHKPNATTVKRFADHVTSVSQLTAEGVRELFLRV